MKKYWVEPKLLAATWRAIYYGVNSKIATPTVPMLNQLQRSGQGCIEIFERRDSFLFLHTSVGSYVHFQVPNNPKSTFNLPTMKEDIFLQLSVMFPDFLRVDNVNKQAKRQEKKLFQHVPVLFCLFHQSPFVPRVLASTPGLPACLCVCGTGSRLAHSPEQNSFSTLTTLAPERMSLD